MRRAGVRRWLLGAALAAAPGPIGIVEAAEVPSSERSGDKDGGLGFGVEAGVESDLSRLYIADSRDASTENFTAPRLGLRWEPIPQLALHAGYAFAAYNEESRGPVLGAYTPTGASDSDGFGSRAFLSLLTPVYRHRYGALYLGATAGRFRSRGNLRVSDGGALVSKSRTDLEGWMYGVSGEIEFGWADRPGVVLALGLHFGRRDSEASTRTFVPGTPEFGEPDTLTRTGRDRKEYGFFGNGLVLRCYF